MKIILVMPSVHDMFAYNESRVKKYAPNLLASLRSSPTFNRTAMAQNSRIVYGKIFSLFSNQYMWTDKHTFSCQNVLNSICRGPYKKNAKAPATMFLSGKSDELHTLKALIDGLHPSNLFIDKFWSKYARFCKPGTTNVRLQQTMLQHQQQQQQMSAHEGPLLMSPPTNPVLTSLPAVNPSPLLITPDLASSRADNDYIVQERERQRMRTRERLMREEERMRRDEEDHLRTLERRQKEEAERLHREREKLRLEREKIERQKQELLRLEREQQRLEREKLERERDELRKQQIKYEEVRRGVKRPAPPSERDRRDYFDDRKRGPERGVPERGVPDRGPPSRGNSDRMPDRGVHRGPDRGNLLRGSDRGGAGRGPDRGPDRDSERGPARGPDRGSDRGGRFSDDGRDSRYERHGGDRGPPMRGSSQYDDRREREDRRPMERAVPRSEGRDHRGPPPPPSMRDRPSRDAHYNGGSISNVPMDTWRTGGVSHASKNGGPNYGSNTSSLLGGGVSSATLAGRGVDGQGSWRPSGTMTTNERWGGNSSIGGRSNSMMDILRGAESYHMGGGQVPINPVPLMSNLSQGERFGAMANFRK